MCQKEIDYLVATLLTEPEKTMWYSPAFTKIINLHTTWLYVHAVSIVPPIAKWTKDSEWTSLLVTLWRC